MKSLHGESCLVKLDPKINITVLIPVLEFIDARLSIRQLQEKLKYAAPFAINGDLDLESVLTKTKYLKVAIQLGAHSPSGKARYES